MKSSPTFAGIALSLAVLTGCVVPPPATGAYPPGSGQASATAATAPSGASCAANIACYGACEPLTEDCVAQCDAAAAPGVPEQSRAVVACMAATGCDTLECLEAQCPSEYHACLAAPAAQVATGVSGGGGAVAVNDGFAYPTVTFDDGWTSTVQADRVVVEKGGVSVHLYYALPYNASDFSGTGRMARDHYWDGVVARELAVESKAYRDGNAMGFPPPYVEGWVRDRATGQRHFAAMYLSYEPNAALITLVLARDEATVFALFPSAADAFQSDLAAMQRYNRFPLGARDVDGTWQEGGGGTMNWYNAQTGAYVGATGVATSAVFTFASDGSYTNVQNGAAGAVGAMGTFQQEYRGRYEAARWQLVATNRFQGATANFSAHLVAVRGGRLLALDDGRGSRYTLVRTSR